MIGRGREPGGAAWVAYRCGSVGPTRRSGPEYPFVGAGELYRFTGHGGVAVRVWFETGAVSSVRVVLVGPLFPAAAFRSARKMVDELERAVRGYAVVVVGPALEASMTVSLPSRRTDQQALEDVVQRVQAVLEVHAHDGEEWTMSGWFELSE